MMTRYVAPPPNHVKRLPGGIEVLDTAAVAADLERQRQAEADARQRADAKHEAEQAAKEKARAEAEAERLEGERQAFVARYRALAPDRTAADAAAAWKAERDTQIQAAMGGGLMEQTVDELRRMRGVRPRSA